MVNVYDVDALDLIDAVKEEFKKNEQITPPEWAQFAKSGAHRERPPEQLDFWYIRGASILRKVCTKGPIGVSRLKTEYGGKKNRGAKPERHMKASGSVIRELMQQLEKAGYIKQQGKKGRVVTPTGMKLLDNAANQIHKTPKVKKEKAEQPAPKKEKTKLPTDEGKKPKEEGKKKWGKKKEENEGAAEEPKSVEKA